MKVKDPVLSTFQSLGCLGGQWDIEIYLSIQDKALKFQICYSQR